MGDELDKTAAVEAALAAYEHVIKAKAALKVFRALEAKAWNKYLVAKTKY